MLIDFESRLSPAQREDFSTRIRALADYAEYNYGDDSAITKACRAGSVTGFMRATSHITEMHDMRIVALQNKIICTKES